MNKELPIEIVAIILGDVGYEQLTQCVCRAWRELVGHIARRTIDLMRCAARDGYLNVLKWGHAQGCLTPQELWFDIIKSTAFDRDEAIVHKMLDWISLFRHDREFRDQIMHGACRMDRLSIVKRFAAKHKTNKKMIASLSSNMCEMGHSVLHWFINKGQDRITWPYTMNFDVIISRDPLEVIKSIIPSSVYEDHNQSFKIFRSAVKYNRIDVLVWLDSFDAISYNSIAFGIACEHSIDVMKWYCSKAIPNNTISNNNIHVCISILRYWHADTLLKLDYADSLGIRMYGVAMNYSSYCCSHGHAHTITCSVEFIRSVVNKYNIKPGVLFLLRAVYSNRYDIVDWLDECYPELMHSEFNVLYSEQLKTIELKMVKRISNEQFHQGSIVWLLKFGRADILEWLLEAGYNFHGPDIHYIVIGIMLRAPSLRMTDLLARMPHNPKSSAFSGKNSAILHWLTRT